MGNEGNVRVEAELPTPADVFADRLVPVLALPRGVAYTLASSPGGAGVLNRRAGVTACAVGWCTTAGGAVEGGAHGTGEGAMVNGFTGVGNGAPSAAPTGRG